MLAKQIHGESVWTINHEGVDRFLEMKMLHDLKQTRTVTRIQRLKPSYREIQSDAEGTFVIGQFPIEVDGIKGTNIGTCNTDSFVEEARKPFPY